MPVAVAALGGRHMHKIKVISCLLDISSEKLEAWNVEITAKINFGTTFTGHSLSNMLRYVCKQSLRY